LPETRRRPVREETSPAPDADPRLIRFLPTHLSLQEIADRLHLSRPTVKTHVASIYGKLGVQGRSQAVEIIEELRLGSTESTVSVPDPDRDSQAGD